MSQYSQRWFCALLASVLGRINELMTGADDGCVFGAQPLEGQGNFLLLPIPTNFIRLAHSDAPKQLSVSLDERVASDWHSRFAQSLAQGCSLPIPKGGAEAGKTLRNATQRRGTTQEATPQRYASCLYAGLLCARSCLYASL
jgi:hypothetical protein